MLPCRITLFCLFLLMTGVAGAQACEDLYTNTTLSIEICNNDRWSIQGRSPFILVSKNNLRVSITAIPDSSGLSPETAWRKEWWKNKMEDSTWTITDTQRLEISGQPAWMAVSYRPGQGTQNSLKKEIHNTSVVFFYNGRRYYINANAYNGPHVQNTQMVRKICAAIRLIKPGEDQLTGSDSVLLEGFNRRFVQAVQYNNEEKFRQLLADAKTVTDALEHLRDRSTAQRLAESIRSNQSSYEENFVEKNVKQFYELVKTGSKQGLKWTEIRYTGYQVQPEPEQIPGVKTVSLVISFNDGKKEYCTGINEVLLLPNGQWRMTRLGSVFIREK